MTTIQLRRGTSQEWVAANPILAPGEVGVELDTNKFKLGDGVTYWSVAEYYVPAPDVMAAIQAEMASHLAAANPHPQYGAASGLPDHIAAADPHPQYSTDADLAAHVAHANPHPVYATDADLAAHAAAADPHPVYATDADLAAHAAAANPHPVYATDSDLLAHRSDPDAHPGYASDAEFDTYVEAAEVRYETKSALLNEALFWVDAGAAESDRLIDLSGNGRDLLYEGSVPPKVLPWSGKDYAYFPHQSDGSEYIIASAKCEITNGTTYKFRVKLEPGRTYGQTYLFNCATLQIYVTTDSRLHVATNDGTAWHSITYTKQLLNDTWYDIFVQLTWAGDGANLYARTDQSNLGTDYAKWTEAHIRTNPAPEQLLIGQYGGFMMESFSADPSGTNRSHILEFNKMSADYCSIVNAGSIGGVWTVVRKVTGFKLSIVDRPILLFGGTARALHYLTKDLDTPNYTVVGCYRLFETGAAVHRLLGTTSGSADVAGSYMYLQGTLWNLAYSASGATIATANVPNQTPYSGPVSFGARSGAGIYSTIRDGTVKSSVVMSGIPILGKTGLAIDVGLSASYEFLGGAIFDRALTDAEIAQVTIDLFGTSHTQQFDPHPQYVTHTEGDILYESKSALLKEAMWYVDAAAVGPAQDRLIDITGNGRDAIFGAGAAAPVPLPWDGEDYAYFSGGNDYAGLFTAASGITTRVVVIKGFFPPGKFGGIMTSGDWSVSVNTQGIIVSQMTINTDQVTLGFYDPAYPWMRFKFTNGEVSYERSLHGDVWSMVASATHTAKTLVTTVRRYIGHGWNVVAANKCKVYYAEFVEEGVKAYIFNPSNVSADYATVANTGTAGGSWTITRNATGWKSVIVNRPLLLFGGGQQAAALTKLGVLNGSTHIVAARLHGAAQDSGVLDTRAGPSNNTGVTIWTRVGSGHGASWCCTYAGQRIDDFQQAGLIGSLTIAGRVGTDRTLSSFVNGLKQASGYQGTQLETLHTYPPTLGSAVDAMFLQGEILAAAIFDRPLTDAEIAQVSAELAGTVKPGTVLVTHPNVDDVLVQVYDGPKARWQTVHYDSGWRDCRSLLNAGVSTVYEGLKVRRVNDQVSLICGFSVVAGWTSNAIATLPAGFYPTLGNDQRQPACSGAPTSMHALFSNGDLYLETGFAGMPYRTNVVAHGCGPIPTSLPGTLMSPAPAYALPGQI